LNAIDGLRIDNGRLTGAIDAVAAINRQADGSCCRIALSDADCEGRRLVLRWLEDAGLDISIDRIGNIFATRRGSEDTAPVMTGSHLDTVATGGRFDGVLGVIGGLEVIRTLDDAGIVTRRPITLAIFTNEEGVRFQPDMMGSLVFSGQFDLQEALDARAAGGGPSLAEELQRTGFNGSAAIGEPRPAAYVELHIEQGPILHRTGGILGAVQSLQGISWQEITINGVSNHAGTTPMSMRHDAAYCASRIAVFLRELTKRRVGQLATVGRINLSPNMINVIAREAKLTVDLRNTSNDELRAAEAELQQLLRDLEKSERVTIASRPLARTDPVRFDETIVVAIEDTAQRLGYPIARMTSGAGHDAQMIAKVAPAAMIFVPSVDGISHNPREHTDPAHLEIGTNMLLHTLVKLATT
jgi:beta-ureidopropionase / N-carbamoyl-L-amino-acid hydrolase